MKKIIHTSNAPAAIGPYSQAVLVQDMLFISGQIPVDSATGQLHGETMSEQTRRVLKNLEAVLIEAGFTKNDVVKTTCFLKDMEKFVEMNTVYAEFFTEEPPARATVEVARLPKDVLVEIEAIAVK